MERYRTREEMIEYFLHLAHDFDKQGHRADNDKDRWYAFGKSAAYAIAAFEIRENMEE